jgi:solute carrier family 6 GABA transporter-like protein 1
LILEVSVGSALRGGPVIAFNSLDRRARGSGLGNLWITLLVVIYYVPMLAWVMRFFRGSFESPLPWEGRLEDFYYNEVQHLGAPSPGNASVAIEQGVMMSYPGASMIGEQVGWTAFSWIVVWLCLYKGVSVTGKVVYVTMGLPIIMIFILIVRGATLPNAIDGIRLFVGEFNGGQLAGGQIWQDALGQVFYSTGVGFGYYTAYASYNAQNANAVQDSVLICCCNSLFEIACALAIFCIVGFLGMTPENTGRVGSFSLGFITLPEGLAQMPGAQVWSVIFFFTLFMLAVSSAFVQIDCVITTLCDTDRGQRIKRVYISTTVIFIAFLISMIYNTEFGSPLLDAIDLNTNNIALPVVVFSECYAATVIYRSIDVIGQTGLVAFIVHQFGFLGGMALGLVLAHAVSIPAGIGAGFGLYFACFAISVLGAKTPDSIAPRFWGRNVFLSRAWWLAFYSVDIPQPSPSTQILTHFPGKPTQARPECHRSSRQKLAIDVVLANLHTLHLLSSARHRLLLQLPILLRKSLGSADDIRFRGCAYCDGVGHCGVYFPTLDGPVAAVRPQRRGSSSVCAASLARGGSY